MFLTLLKAKLHNVCVTSSDLEYQGSIAIDEEFMKKIGILPNERVDVYNITTGARFTTYAIKAQAGSRVIGVRGAAAHLASKGDRVIIACYAMMKPEEAKNHEPNVLIFHGDLENNHAE